ncbi:hypothetical protein Cni_G13558 [Canna indica]|uniref:Uncharacterized protein n=1 Tax=Canna indica TaxID=4628 RepID=A0AAQ3Q9Y2_9LILI|nr:hypothetical protein Cni_G13558 [Canna indica]
MLDEIPRFASLSLSLIVVLDQVHLSLSVATVAKVQTRRSHLQKLEALTVATMATVTYVRPLSAECSLCFPFPFCICTQQYDSDGRKDFGQIREDGGRGRPLCSLCVGLMSVPSGIMERDATIRTEDCGYDEARTYIMNEYGNIDFAYGDVAKTYINWLASMATSLDTSTPWESSLISQQEWVLIDSHPEYVDYGIDETEGSSLLGHEEPYLETRKLCLDWCILHNIEYIEACASNADFDRLMQNRGTNLKVSVEHFNCLAFPFILKINSWWLMMAELMLLRRKESNFGALADDLGIGEDEE